MRIQQQRLLKKAKSNNFSCTQIQVLYREEIPMPILTCAYDYLFLNNQHGIEHHLTANEVDKWFDFMIYVFLSKKEREEMKNE